MLMNEDGPAPRELPPAAEPRSDPATWLARHGDSLWRFAMSRVRNADTAEELIQETLLAALKARDTFEGRSTERTWLLSILRHKIADRRRKSARSPAPLAEQPLDVLDTMFDGRGRWKVDPGRWPRNPDQLLDQPEFRADFERCLSRVPAGLAEAFILREVRSLAAETICQTLAITADNLWVRLHRARLLLRKCLERRWGTPARRKEARK
jgi:RNA polymerase sigma-70 factor, ECF subfamily